MDQNTAATHSIDDHLYRAMHAAQESLRELGRIADAASHDPVPYGYEACLRINSFYNALLRVTNDWYREHIVDRATAAYAAADEE